MDARPLVADRGGSAPTAAAASWWLYTAIVLAAVAIRAPTLGDPNYHVDEGFYLLVGDQMRHGALPYVDIWDRKPLGLFLLYAAFAIVGNGSMVAVQLGAAASAAATALLLADIARRWVSPLPALLVAISYLAGLEALAGGGGQTPVFYNLLVTAMARSSLCSRDADTPARCYRWSIAAVLYGGLALTIKPTCLPECLLFGSLVALETARQTRSMPCSVARGASMLLVGLMPSLLCLLLYAALGHARDYLFAIVLSSLYRAPMAMEERLSLARFLVPRVVPLICMAIAGIVALRPTAPRDCAWLVAWVIAALLGFLMVPNFYDHYALQLLPSMSLAMAPLFARRPLGPAFAITIIAASVVLSGWPAYHRTSMSVRAMTSATQVILAHGGGRSLYVFDGPPSLYTLAHAPLPTRWVFPEHLSTEEERNAIGTDSLREVALILRHWPAVIVAADDPGRRHPARDIHLMVRATLARRYERVATFELPDFGGGRTIGIFSLKELASG